MRPREPARPQASGQDGWVSGLAGWASGLAGQPRGGIYGWTNKRTDIQTYRRTENLPILQDFVPYQGRCPKSTILNHSPNDNAIEITINLNDGASEKGFIRMMALKEFVNWH